MVDNNEMVSLFAYRIFPMPKNDYVKLGISAILLNTATGLTKQFWHKGRAQMNMTRVNVKFSSVSE